MSEIAKSMKTTKISKNDSVVSFPTWNSLCAGPKAWSFVGWAKSLVFCGLCQKLGVLVGWAQSLVFCGLGQKPGLLWVGPKAWCFTGLGTKPGLLWVSLGFP